MEVGNKDDSSDPDQDPDDSSGRDPVDSSAPDPVDSSEAWDLGIVQEAEAVAAAVVVVDVGVRSSVDDPNGRLK